MGLLCLGYFVCAWLGRALSPAGGTAVSFWLPGGLYVAVLLVNPTRDWPWLMAAVLPANLGFDLLHDPNPHWLMLAGFCAANVFQAGAGAWLVRRFIAERPALRSLKEFFGLLGLVGLAAAVSAAAGTAVLVAMKFAPSFWPAWQVWWGGNVMAVLVLSPLVLVFGWRRTRAALVAGWTPLRILEAAVVYGGMLAFLWFVLVAGKGIGSPKIPVLIFVLWAALRFGLPGATVMVFLLAVASSFLTTHYLRGLSPEEIRTGSYVFTLQIFVAVTAIVAMVPTIVLAERDRALAAERAGEEQLRATLENTPHVAVQWFDRTGRVRYWNRASETMYGWTAAEAQGQTLGEMIFTREQADGFVAVLAQIEKSGQPVGPVEFSFRRRDGSVGVLLSTLFQIPQASGGPCFVCMDVDLTERKFEEELNRTQMAVLEMISTGQPFKETLAALLRLIEAQSPDMHTSILLLDADGVHMRHGAAPSLPGEYVRAIDGFAIGPAVGSCGTAAWRRAAVYVADIENDPLWAAFKQLVLPHGLRACWSTPVLDEQKNILGTFAIYYRQVKLPDARHQRLVQMATHTAAVCIAKNRAERGRRESVAREAAARGQFTFQLIAQQEAERKRIAGEIHDSLGQNLLLIKNLAQMSLRQQEPAKTYEQVASISNLAQQCINEARQISHDLRPPQLDHLGLTRALAAMIDNAAQASDIKFARKFDAVDEIFPTEAAMNFYRIVQESLNNILKHSRAKNVSLRLERDIHEVQLVITDDGCGFKMDDSANGGKGLGLKNINERVRMLGGKLKMNSAPDQGTRIEVTVPISEKTEA